MKLNPEHEFFVGIDSDGCVFDTMELKHKECFIPQFINHFELQGVSRFAREAAEFVNLYSKSRGCNRFLALIEQLDWLGRRPEVRSRGLRVPELPGIKKWIAEETKLGNPVLEEAVRTTGDADLKKSLAWSLDVNETIARIVRGVPPFPSVRRCLEKLKEHADMLVVSATPNAALQAEWDEHDVSQYVRAIRGQESGTKKETLALAREYEPAKRLMIGDAPGDYNAARANECLFFPINPGAEETSWQAFCEGGIDRFLAGTFAGTYQEDLLRDFNACLPETPPWPVV